MNVFTDSAAIVQSQFPATVTMRLLFVFGASAPKKSGLLSGAQHIFRITLNRSNDPVSALLKNPEVETDILLSTLLPSRIGIDYQRSFGKHAPPLREDVTSEISVQIHRSGNERAALPDCPTNRTKRWSLQVETTNDGYGEFSTFTDIPPGYGRKKPQRFPAKREELPTTVQFEQITSVIIVTDAPEESARVSSVTNVDYGFITGSHTGRFGFSCNKALAVEFPHSCNRCLLPDILP